MFENGLLFWSFPAPRHWISWFVLHISPMVCSFLTQFISQLTTQSCVSSPLWFTGVFVSVAYPFSSYSPGHATLSTVWCFRILLTRGNVDDLLKHKSWFQQGSLFEMDVKFTYNCLQIKNLLQTLSFKYKNKQNRWQQNFTLLFVADHSLLKSHSMWTCQIFIFSTQNFFLIWFDPSVFYLPF